MTLAGACVAPEIAPAKPRQGQPHKEQSLTTMFDNYFLEIVQGFLRNARRTSPSFAVCDFPDGTVLKSCVARNGKTYVSVARMLPALAAWVKSGRGPTRFEIEGEEIELNALLLAIYRHAFDPNHPDYWGEPPRDRAAQLQVEASMVGYALWQLGDPFLAQLTSAERTNIQTWLASCTRVPERVHNHAWFSAINQATRLALAPRWKEFVGDEDWMLEDIKALDKMATVGSDGWYSDAPDMPVYDYYNFWTFANFPLYWSRIIGDRYPQWQARFRERVQHFLPKTPYFFGANGSHVLFGRSLIYRWAVLSPLVLAYEEKLWPHSPGLLRAIVRRNLEFHWNLGAFDAQRGKLRETFSPQGNPEIREAYIDNGHPYWAMQSFSFFAIPAADPFWHAPEEPLPIERANFQVPFDGPRMILSGHKSSGQVRWLQAHNGPRRDYYRDKYVKFSYSSHFPFNILREKDRCPWDATLVLRDRKSGTCAGRAGVRRGELLDNGIQTEWWIQLDEKAWDITTRVQIFDEFELRTHRLTIPDDVAATDVEIIEGSYALGLTADEQAEVEPVDNRQALRSRHSGSLLVSWNLDGYEKLEASESFSESGRRDVNIVYPRMVVNTLRAPVSKAHLTFASLHYASPQPLPMQEILRRAAEIIAQHKGSAV